ncbi:MAG: hypothetical protein O7G86_16145, partial [Gammaproteobacteria bacterium]|nr:hypothetical protein [Gammaproteobacteria bacterium]
ILSAVGLDGQAEEELARAKALGFESSPGEKMAVEVKSEFLTAVADGDLDSAFHIAEALAEQRGNLLHLLWSDKLTGFRQDPRFSKLMGTVGLTNYWRRYGWADSCGRDEGSSICG